MTSHPIVNETKSKMQKGLEFFVESLKGLRTGNVTPALVDGVRVEAYGSPMPLNQIATISVPEPRQLLVKPFDPSMCTAIEKGILKSDLGITPETDGKVVRLNVPMMSQEQRDKMAHRAKDLAEQAKVTVRNIRRDQNKLADGSGASDDELEAMRDEIQKFTKDTENEIDKICKERIAEIQGV
ncbi:MAG: ribosome recycling factor [Planctomycetes bacterium]|nr:ribosome recycling factor [Planctomycetota bacterium]